MVEMRHLEAVAALLGPLPSRKLIRQATTLPTTRQISLHVIRSMPFEYVASLLPFFTRIGRIETTFTYSDYDPALSSLQTSDPVNGYLFWIDWRLYRKSLSPVEAVKWFAERISSLENESKKHPILVNNWPENLEPGESLFSSTTGSRAWIRTFNQELSSWMETHPEVVLIDLAWLTTQLQDSAFDRRNDEVSHYPFSDECTRMIARHLGSQLFPAISGPRLKAIALDLDDTLYQGTLGEDGIEGITLTEGHIELQEILLRLKESGIMLTLCSRNELQDVEELFNKRTDFPLTRADFATVEVNWSPKAENLQKIAQTLNIDPSAILFIDDNPSELLKVGHELPTIRLLLAGPTGKETSIRLSHYPELFLLRSDALGTLRTADIQANQQREELKRQAVDFTSYLQSLEMIVTVSENEPTHAARLYDLSNKTNQFNLSLQRMTPDEAQTAIFDRDHYLTLTVSLADRLSDSGVVGAFVCHINGNEATLQETLFSCRALGRGIETLSLYHLVKKLKRNDVQKLFIDITKGPRNAPAIEWIALILDQEANNMTEQVTVDVQDFFSQLEKLVTHHPAKVEERT